MSTITTLATSDNGAVSRTTINTNFTNLNTDKIETSVLDTDTALTGNSDTKVATQKATKTYVDTVAGLATKVGVGTGPASSTTQTITHSLGRVPSAIHIYGKGLLKGSASSQSGGTSDGIYASGNYCVYATASVTAGDNAIGTSTSFSIYLSGLTAVATEVHATGVIQNVTTTTFDIVWTASADCSTATVFMWEVK